jgi:hypothetical protein
MESNDCSRLVWFPLGYVAVEREKNEINTLTPEKEGEKTFALQAEFATACLVLAFDLVDLH